MSESRAGSLSLVGGAPALDFANTMAGRDSAAPVEHLQAAADVVAWAAHAGCLDAATAKRCMAALAADPGAARGVLREARRLRDAIHGIGAALARAAAPEAADLAGLKEVAWRALGAAELAPASGRYRFDFTAAPVEAALLGPVAWSALDLLRNGGFDRLKQCANRDCGWLFLDGSKNNSRRWCDMATCGNLAKGRRHRNRRRAVPR